mgnify:CR=1 FL=1
MRGSLRRHARFHGAFAAGLAAALLGGALTPTDRILIGADLFFVVYLVATAIWVLMATGAVGVSLYAIAQTVLASADPGALRLRPVLALGAVPLGWATVHAVMAFHYARMFYTPDRDAGRSAGATAAQTGARDSGGLDFPGGPAAPGPWEFLYYSFTLGMTAQTSDVGLTSTAFRRVTLAHSVLGFFYNAVIVALAVNAGLALGQGG